MQIKAVRDHILRTCPFLCYFSIFFNIKKLGDVIKVYRLNITKGSLKVQNLSDYKWTFLKFCFADVKNIKVAEEFYKADINIIIENYNIKTVNDTDVVLVCVIKDDIEKLVEFMSHYRKLGVHYFAFLDNGSTDGTKEYLAMQRDVNLYYSSDFYTTYRREAWVNRIYAYYGYNHWFVCVDSDELLAYTDCYVHKIHEVIEKVKKKRFLALMIDLYPKGDVLNQNSLAVSSFSSYKFCDRDSYYKVSSYKMEALYGGPRKRVFSLENKGFNCRLTKYPVFFYEKGDVQGCSHYLFPFKHNFQNNVQLLIFHYKFFKSDIDKYKERAKIGNYSSGSFEYKVYASKLKNNDPLHFYWSKSVELKGLDKLRFLVIKGFQYEPLF